MSRADQNDIPSLELFKRFMESSGQCLGIASLTGRIVYINPCFAKLLGVQNPSELYQSPIFTFYEPGAAERLRSEILPAVLQDGQWVGELELINRLGRSFACIQNIFLIRDDDGQALYFANISTDISERRKLEQALACDRDQLEALAAQRTQELEASNVHLRERITEHQQTEEKLGRLVAILNSTSDLVATAYPDGEVLYLNAAGRHLLGLSNDQDLQGFSMADGHPAWAWQIVEQEGLPHAIREGVWRGLTAIRNPNGTEIPISQVIMAHRDADGRLEYVSTIMRDITERRQTEEALKTWTRRYDFLVEASGQVVYEYIIASQAIIWGHNVESVLGYRLEEMTGGIAQWTAMIHPDDRPASLALLEQAEQACSFWDTQYRLRHKDGHYVWIRDRGYFIAGPDGQAERQLGLIEDITERKQAETALRESERRFATTFHSSPTLIVITNEDSGRIVEINDRFLKVVGYSRDEVIGRTSLELNYWVDLANRQTLIEALQNDGIVTDLEFRFRDKQGGEHWGLCSAARIEIAGESYLLTQNTDITERKQAALALAESEAKLQEAHRLAHLGYWSWNVKTGQVEWSEELYRIFGLDPASFTPSIESIEAMSPWSEYANRGQEMLAHALESRASGSYEQRFLRPDQSVGYYAASFQGKYDEAGELVAIVGALQDITARKQAEEAQAENEAKLQEAQGLAHLGYWSWNVKTGQVEWSEELYKIFGQDPTSFTPSITSIMALSPWPEDNARDQELISRAIESHASGSYEQRFLRPDQSIGYYVSSFQGKYDEAGGLVAIVGTVLDITARKQAEMALRESEEKFRMIFELAPMSVAINDTEGRYVDVNAKMCERTGLARERLIGRSYGELPEMSRFENADVSRMIQQKLQEEGRLDGEEIRLIRPSTGERLDCLLFACQVTIAGQPCTISMILDITERKHLENQLQQAQKMESIGRLAGGVAHDFNNLLTAISGNAELGLMQADLSPKQAGHLNEIAQAAVSAAELTKQLLAFSRKQIVELKAVDLNELIWSTGKMLSRVLGEDINLHTVAQPGLNRILADSGQLQQIIMNLAVNARDAMPQGGTLTLETANIALDEAYCQQFGDILPGEYVLLSVSDSGCGMTAEVKEHIFEPFFTTKALGKGTGLGLATVYGAVKQNHGVINVYSEPGQGTCFRIYLPKTESVPETLAPAPASPMPGGHETILLAEDDPRVRGFACKALERLGYRILAAASGEEALELARSQTDKIDLLFTDVVMPGMNGRQLADALLSERPDLKVLFASGYTQDAIVSHGVLEHDIDFIGKPYGARDLALKLRAILDRA